MILSKEPFIKTPKVYVDEESLSIVYFTFDDYMVEKVLNSLATKPEYSPFQVPNERFWKQAKFKDNSNLTAAAQALRLTFI